MGFIFGGSSGKKEADAITQSSQQEAAASREAARGDVMAQQTMLAQDNAAKQAEELLSRPTGTVDVELQSTDPQQDTLDPATGKRRTKRQTYSSGAGGISI